MKRSAIWFIMLLTGCSVSQPQGTILSVTVVGEGAGKAGLAAQLADEMTTATLIKRNEAGQLVGDLASSWRFVDNGQVLILRLRPLKWSDGKPLVASDVVSSFRRAAQPPRPGPAFRLAGLVGAGDVARGANSNRLGVLAPTSRVVELRLEVAGPQLLDWLAEPGLSVNRTDVKSLAPYARQPGKKAEVPIILVRKSEEASPNARPNEIMLTTTPDAGAAIAAFRRGASDIVVGAGLTGLGEARVQTRREALRIDQLHGVYGWRVNTISGPLADASLRRLLAARIDRSAIARSFGLAAIQPESGLLPANLRVATVPSDVAPPATPEAAGEPAVAIPADTQSATEQARTAAAAGGAVMRLRLLVPPGREHALVAERVAAGWRALGVEIILQEADAAMRARLIARGDFDLAVDETSLSVADPAALLDRFRCKMGPHCNDEADALLAAARLAPADQRPGQLAVVEQRLLEGTPFIGLFGAVRWALVGAQVENWVSNTSGVHPLGRLGQGKPRN